MTQSSLAVGSVKGDWAILNASPDLRMQLAATDSLRPTGLREVPIRSVVVTNGDIDHIAGLLSMREKQPFRLFATPAIHAAIAANPVFDALDPAVVERLPVQLNEAFTLVDGISATLFPVPGKVPLYLEAGEVVTDLEGEQTVGVALRSDRAAIFYIPGCARMTADLANRLDGADYVFFDGTLWEDDEMIRQGLGQKTGRRMGHMPISGPDGSVAAFAGLRIGAKVFVHMNNSNPVVDAEHPAHRTVRDAGWIVAHDAMEFSL